MDAGSRRLSAPPILAYGLLIVLLGGSYLSTLLPGVGYSGDTAKFQFVGKLLGTPHATGYPTYVLLNHFFVTLFPWGTLAFRANLLSALFSIGAILLLFRILLALNVSRLIAFFMALIFGLTSTLWLQSVVAEVYTLHLLFIAAVIYFFIRWTQTRRDRHFLAACALYAFSFGNHQTSITLLPAIVYLVWATDKRAFADRKKILWVTVFILLSVLQYSYIFWRVRDPSTPYLEMRPHNLAEFLWYMTGAKFQSKMFVFSLEEILTQRLPMAGQLIWKQFFVLIPVALYGVLRFKPKTLNIFLILCVLGNLFFAVNYDIFDIFVYFIPSYLILAIYLGVGLESIKTLLPRRALAPAAVLLALAPVALVAINYGQVDQRHNTADAGRVEAILHTLDRDAVILSPDYHTSEYLWYYLLAGDFQNRDIYVFHGSTPHTISAYLDGEHSFELPSRRGVAPFGLPVYSISANQSPGLEDSGFSLAEVGDNLYRVTDGPAVAPK